MLVVVHCCFCDVGCCSSFIAVFVMLLFIHCFSMSSLTLPWAIAGFLHSFYTFSPAHRTVIRDTFILTFLGSSFTVLPRALRFWAGISTHRRFLPYAPSPHFYHNLLLSRPSWEPAVLPWSLQGFMLILETQTRLIWLFDLQQSTILIFRRIRT